MQKRCRSRRVISVCTAPAFVLLARPCLTHPRRVSVRFHVAQGGRFSLGNQLSKKRAKKSNHAERGKEQKIHLKKSLHDSCSHRLQCLPRSVPARRCVLRVTGHTAHWGAELLVVNFGCGLSPPLGGAAPPTDEMPDNRQLGTCRMWQERVRSLWVAVHGHHRAASLALAYLVHTGCGQWRLKAAPSSDMPEDA